MGSGDTHYAHTLATPALRNAIVAKLARDNGLIDNIEAFVRGEPISDFCLCGSGLELRCS